MWPAQPINGLPLIYDKYAPKGGDGESILIKNFMDSYLDLIKDR